MGIVVEKWRGMSQSQGGSALQNEESAVKALADYRRAQTYEEPLRAADLYSRLYRSYTESSLFAEAVAHVPKWSESVIMFDQLEKLAAFLDLDVQNALETRLDAKSMLYKHPPEILLLKILSEALIEKLNRTLAEQEAVFNPYKNPNLKERFLELVAPLSIGCDSIDKLEYTIIPDFKERMMTSILATVTWLYTYTSSVANIKLLFVENKLDVIAKSSITQYQLLSIGNREAKSLFNYVNAAHFGGLLGSVEALESLTNSSFASTLNAQLQHCLLQPSATFETSAIYAIIAMLAKASPETSEEADALARIIEDKNQISAAVIAGIESIVHAILQPRKPAKGDVPYIA